MTPHPLKPRQALNKAFLKLKPNRAEIELFKANLTGLLDRANDLESEEFHKNLVSGFLRETWYGQRHFINTKGRNDLVIHNGPDAKSTVGVIIEAKKPANKSEMATTEKLNAKAFQELVLYYLRERITLNNLEVKHLIITNLYEWFIFDATVFDRLFAQNKLLVKQFTDFEGGRLADTKTDFFYRQIAAPFIDGIASEIEFTHFNFHDYEKPLRNADKSDDTKLIALFKLLSPEHLLKLPFMNDSNSLDRRFYNELLHILGLTETKSGGKKLIERNKPGERNAGTILENTILQLESLDKLSHLDNADQYGNTADDRLFNIALELSITWINRILFLKLLEAQLTNYHKGDQSFSFLNLEKISNYDDLNSLFFQVLARKPHERHPDVKQLFEKVPYLNSSLFEPTDLEHAALFISNLRDDKTTPILPTTVLKYDHGRRKTGNLSTLDYLFAFLNAYDFSSEGSEEIQEENKTLINASVLGLIFEKINGYKDGSFFTPGFITMYMCRETIRKAVMQKFNETKNWNCKDFSEVKEDIQEAIRAGDRKEVRAEANRIVNSIKICDPAVGSGHFLVSALNEMIAIKSELKILVDKAMEPINTHQVEVVNDELVVTDLDEQLFEYNPNNRESQRVQETLFHEKQTIIENCLFGVDINPNSVKICRLRLWIELLKNAYYKQDLTGFENLSGLRELETLPNIDINIKCGNSLVSRFALNTDLKQIARSAKWNIFSYQNAVEAYKKSPDKEVKRELEKLIRSIKTSYVETIQRRNPKLQKYYSLKLEYDYKFPENGLFAHEPEVGYGENARQLENEKQRLIAEIQKIQAEIEAEKHFFETHNAFEWRFEFPEVLNEDGEFLGFDIVLSNPPYIRQEGLSKWKEYFKSRYEVFAGTADLLVYFFELSSQIMKPKGHCCLITSNKFVKANYGRKLREFLLKVQLEQIVDFGELPVFDEASTFPAVYSFSKRPREYPVKFAQISTLDFSSLTDMVAETVEVLPDEAFGEDFWSLGSIEINSILQKMRENGIDLGKYLSADIYRGVITGFNRAFVIDQAKRDQLILEDPKSAEIIFPFAIGDDIRYYHIRDSKRYIILTKIGVNIERYPAVFNHLKKFQKELEKRWDKGKFWWELRACDYYDAFKKPKIVYPDIAKESRFTLSKEVKFFANTCYFLPTGDKYLLALLNSKLIWFYYSQIASVLGDAKQGGRLRWFSQDVMKIPIASPSKSRKTLSDLASKILRIKQINPNADTRNLEKKIDQLVYQLYGLTEEEIRTVEESVR